MRIFSSVVVLCAISLPGVVPDARAFEHPGGLHSRRQIEVTREHLAAREEPWWSAWEALRKQADRGLQRTPEAVADFNVPGYYVDAAGHRETMGRLSRDAWVAYACAVTYQLTSGGDRARYGDKAVQVLDAWATTNRRYSGADGQLAMADAGAGLVFAAELLTDYDGWEKGQRAACEAWIRSVYLRASTDIVVRENNWGDWGVLGCIASHHVLDMEEAVDRDIERIRERIDKEIAGDGHMPAETKRGKRGLWYTYFALAPLTSACQIALNARGTDLFHHQGEDGAGIEEALDYLLRYCRDPGQWPHYRGSDISPPKPDRFPGNLFEAMSGIYNKQEYADWVEDARPIMVYGHHYAWSLPTLLRTVPARVN